MTSFTFPLVVKGAANAAKKVVQIDILVSTSIVMAGTKTATISAVEVPL